MTLLETTKQLSLALEELHEDEINNNHYGDGGEICSYCKAIANAEQQDKLWTVIAFEENGYSFIASTYEALNSTTAMKLFALDNKDSDSITILCAIQGKHTVEGLDKKSNAAFTIKELME